VTFPTKLITIDFKLLQMTRGKKYEPVPVYVMKAYGEEEV